MSQGPARQVWDLIRPVIFWCHLATGAVVGVVVFIMSVTGVALAYQRQTLEWIARRHAVSAAGDVRRERLPLDSLAARATAAAGGRRVTGLTVRADAGMPVSATLSDRSALFVDPYTGQVLGTDAGPRGFFAAAERMHRSIVSQGTTRSETGTVITGAANLAFLFLIVSGFVLWWPRRWTPQAFRRVLVPKTRARGKARDWNWHHVLGFWCAPVLLLVVASATFISYEWPQRLVERALGQSPAGRDGPRGGRAERPTPSLDRVWEQGLEGEGEWQSVQLRVPEGGGPVSVTISHTGAFRPNERTTVTVAADGAVERRPYAALDPARRFRAWMRPLHTGEVGGVPGQTLAALASAAAAVLVWTGLALAWRRLRATIRGRAAPRALELSR